MEMRMKSIRIDRNLSIDKASELIGISPETLRNYETYKTYPDAKTINKILEVYDVNFDDISFLPRDYKFVHRRKK